MNPFPFSLLATGIGSMPHADAGGAVRAVRRALPELPAWPQLPGRSPGESMGEQFRDGSPDRAAGLFQFLEEDFGDAVGVKGQVTGPITYWLLEEGTGGPDAPNLTLDRNGQHGVSPSLPGAARHIAKQAARQRDMLAGLGAPVLIFLDEPLLPWALAEGVISPEAARVALGDALEGLGPALRGVHCCGDPPWTLLTSLPLNAISFDALAFGESAVEHAATVGAFLTRGGAVAWGAVPAGEAAAQVDGAADFTRGLLSLWRDLEQAGAPFELLVERAMVTPVCGLAGASPQAAERALGLAREVAALLRAWVTPPADGPTSRP